MHADHYLDIVGLRYLYPVGRARARPAARPPAARAAGTGSMRCAGHLGAGRVLRRGLRRRRVRPGPPLADRRRCAVRFVRGRHYVPAWGVVVEAPDGARLGYTGDTGPSDAVDDGRRATSTCCSSRPPSA